MDFSKKEVLDLAKKEWRAIALTLCFIVLFIFLLRINSRLNDLSAQNAKLISTLDTVESVTLGTDANVAGISKKIDGIDAGMIYTVQKLKRR